MKGAYLMIAPQGLGDALEATPFAAALRKAQPDARIDVAVLRPGPKELFEGLPELVDDVVYLPFWDGGAPPFVRELLRSRRKKRYNAAFLMYPAAKREYQWMMRAFSAQRRYAHRYFEPALQNFLWLNSDLVEVLEHGHNVLQNLQMLRAAGFECEIPERYSVPRTWIDSRPRDGKRIAIHVGTIAHNGLEARRWPAERFEEIARRSLGRGYDVALIMGPAERQETLAINRALPDAHIVCGPLAEIARYLSTCALVLSNDSGIAHLAAGVGAPVIALFGPTAAWRHGPYGVNTLALRPSGCPPCFDPRLLNTKCALNIGHRCLHEDMPVDVVDVHVQEMLLRCKEKAPAI